jgi:spoIIIJ-associated protein
MSDEDVKMPEGVESLIVDFANRVFDQSGLDLTARAEQTEEGLKVEVRGADIAILLGHNAELLDAMEYLASRVLARATGDDSRIAFDSKNYRARRERELQLMAEHAAERVRVSRVPFSFDPMNPNERRIIHLALAGDKAVRTESHGNGENRKVTIYPA